MAPMVSAKQIRTARERLGESQEAFAKRFGVDQSTIARWEDHGPPQRGPGPIAIKWIMAELRAEQ